MFSMQALLHTPRNSSSASRARAGSWGPPQASHVVSPRFHGILRFRAWGLMSLGRVYRGLGFRGLGFRV